MPHCAAVAKNFKCNFYTHTKSEINAKFQLSRLIFIFISYQQLLTAVQMLKFFFESWILLLVLKLVCVPSFSLIGWLGARLESVTHAQTDGRTHGRTDARTHARQVKLGLLRLSWARAWAWVEQLTISLILIIAGVYYPAITFWCWWNVHFLPQINYFLVFSNW